MRVNSDGPSFVWWKDMKTKTVNMSIVAICNSFMMFYDFVKSSWSKTSPKKMYSSNPWHVHPKKCHQDCDKDHPSHILAVVNPLFDSTSFQHFMVVISSAKTTWFSAFHQSYFTMDFPEEKICCFCYLSSSHTSLLGHQKRPISPHIIQAKTWLMPLIYLKNSIDLYGAK